MQRNGKESHNNRVCGEPLSRRDILGVALAGAMAATTPAMAQTKQSHGRIVWKADPKLLSKLQPEAEAQEYGIRPPKDYTYLSKPENSNRIFLWQGERRANRSAPRLTITLGDIAPAERSPRKMEELLDLFVLQLRAAYEDWNQVSREYGIVSGQRFGRIHWDGIEPVVTADASGKRPRTHGFAYVMVRETKYFAIITALDLAPYYRTTLDMLEASALTFHKR